MNSYNNPFFSVVKQSDTLLSWKQNKSLSIVLMGVIICIASVLPFSLGVAFMLSNFVSPSIPSIGTAFNILISMSLLMAFIDITSVSVLFNPPTDKGYVRIHSLQELASKKLRVAVLVILSIAFITITDMYWFPTITLSNALKIFSSIGLLFLSFTTQFFTIGMIVMGLSIMQNSYSITIDYKSKIIEKESVGLWKKSKKSINFDELTSLIVKPISSPKLRWELVIMCKEKGLQIYIGSKNILKIYASHLQPLLNLPIELAQ